MQFFSFAVFTVLGVVTLTDAQLQFPSGKMVRAARSGGTETRWNPWVTSASPAPGESEVNPALTEILVTFDRDMCEGMSWTGDGANYPDVPVRTIHRALGAVGICSAASFIAVEWHAARLAVFI